MEMIFLGSQNICIDLDSVLQGTVADLVVHLSLEFLNDKF